MPGPRATIRDGSRLWPSSKIVASIVRIVGDRLDLARLRSVWRRCRASRPRAWWSSRRGDRSRPERSGRASCRSARCTEPWSPARPTGARRRGRSPPPDGGSGRRTNHRRLAPVPEPAASAVLGQRLRLGRVPWDSFRPATGSGEGCRSRAGRGARPAWDDRGGRRRCARTEARVGPWGAGGPIAHRQLGLGQVDPHLSVGAEIDRSLAVVGLLDSRRARHEPGTPRVVKDHVNVLS